LVSTTLCTFIGPRRSTAHHGFVSFNECAHFGTQRQKRVLRSPSLAKPAIAPAYTLLRNAGLFSAALYVASFDSPTQYT